MAKSEKTLVVMVLDESASMSGVVGQTINGFNEYVGDLRKKKGFKVCLNQFNSYHLQPGKVTKAGDVKDLDRHTYVPQGITPLYDAIGLSVKAAEDHKGPVLVVIMTDGYENASSDYDQRDIFDLISEKKDAGWTFVFLGADQDAWAASKVLGIPKGNTLSYDSMETHRTMKLVSDQTLSYAREGSVQTGNFFNQEAG